MPNHSSCGFIPTNRSEMQQRGWDALDILFVNGDAYVDHPSFGVSLLARMLESRGFRVGILAQPDWKDPASFACMGRPRLFAAVSSGAMDSMVNHYTAAKKIRRDDAYSPGGVAGRRPNRAVIVYCGILKGVFKGLPLLIGGIEASLRRFAHYDYWEDRVRRSILLDSKADLLLYGMAEKALLEISRRASQGEDVREMRDLSGTAWVSSAVPPTAIPLPSFEEVSSDKKRFAAAYRKSTEIHLRGTQTLTQSHGERILVINPPSAPLSTQELDAIYALPFQGLPHPGYEERIPAFEQIRHSITTHRGCYGGCSFCAITHHQGKSISSRSRVSILAEVRRLGSRPGFRGTISDLGGPTANMYGTRCGKSAPCGRPSCLHPAICDHLEASDEAAVSLLREVRRADAVKHVFVASGVRYDLMPKQPEYFSELFDHHVGGLLKIAPEHVCPEVTAWMRKPGPEVLEDFLRCYWAHNARQGISRSLIPYFIAGHPGCTLEHMAQTALFLKKHRLQVEQVQEFTPTPGTYSTCLYHTGEDPYTGKAVHVPRSDKERRLQKALLLYHRPDLRRDLAEALKLCGRADLLGQLSAPVGFTKKNFEPAKKHKPAKRKDR